MMRRKIIPKKINSESTYHGYIGKGGIISFFFLDRKFLYKKKKKIIKRLELNFFFFLKRG